MVDKIACDHLAIMKADFDSWTFQEIQQMHQNLKDALPENYNVVTIPMEFEIEFEEIYPNEKY